MPKGSPSRKDRLSRTTWPSQLLLILALLVPTSHALAHRVVLFAYVEGDTVFTESYFSDGKRCQNSRIEVFDASGNKLLEGKTDKSGEFSFKRPKPTDLRMVLTASMGHKDEYVIPAGELSKGAEGKAWQSDVHEAGKKVFQEEKRGAKGAPVGQLTRHEMEQIPSLVEDGLDKKLEPTMGTRVKRPSTGISFIRVIGGISFIFGIMCIILYFRSRRGRKKEGPLHGS